MDHMEQEIDLRQLLAVLRKRLRLIVLITVLATLVSAVVSFFVLTPVYEATTEVLVNKSEPTDQLLLNAQYIDANLKLVETYKVILQSPRILDKVSAWPGVGYTTEELRARLSIATVKNSQVIAISFQDPDPARAALVVNAVARTFQREIPNIMKVDNVQILTEAQADPDAKPVKPRPILNMALAFVLGLMVSMGLAFLLEFLDTSIKTEQDVERELGLPVLGAIGVIEKRSGSPRRAVSGSAVPGIRAQLEVAAARRGGKRVGEGA